MTYKLLELSFDQRSNLRVLANNHPLELAKTKLGGVIAQAMRAACPVTGFDYDKFMTVLLKPGEQIAEHSHKRHAILFYPELCDPVIVNGKCVYPELGEIIYIKPGVKHRVGIVEKPRLSVAMLVSE